MKILLILFILSGLLNLSYTQQDLTKIFDSTALTISGRHLEIATRIHPSLIYPAYLIKENIKNPSSYRDAIKLFNLQMDLSKDRKGRFIDSIENKIDDLPINKLKRIEMIKLFEEYEEDMEDDLEKMVETVKELKHKLNYDENFEKYYVHCFMNNNYTISYNSGINYSALITSQSNNEFKSLLSLQNNFDIMTKNEQENYIKKWLNKWSYLNYAKEENKPDLINLAQNINKSDFHTKNKILVSISFNKVLLFKGSLKPFMYQNATQEVSLKYSTQILSIMGGTRIKVLNEESVFGWIDLLLGIGINHISYDIDEVNSTIDSDYKYAGVGYDYDIGGYESFRKFSSEGNIPTFNFSIITPFFYWNENLFLSGGIDVLYLNTKKEVSVNYVIKNVPYSQDKNTVYQYDEVYKYEIENPKLNISPSFFINYNILDYLTLKLGGSLNNVQVSILTGINF